MAVIFLGLITRILHGEGNVKMFYCLLINSFVDFRKTSNQLLSC